jgi:polar amino acid transport system substrate-binding protein
MNFSLGGKNMIRWTLVVIAAVILGTLLGACAPAAKPALKVGTSADYPPYESKDDKGNYVGFDMDLIREVGKRIGRDIQIVDMGFDGLIAAVQEGKVDAVIAAMQATDARKEKVDFSAPYHFVQDAFLVGGNSNITLKSAKDAAAYKVGVQTGTIQEKWIVDNLVTPGLMKDENVFRYERADNAALDLQAGRIDTVLIISDAAQKLAKDMGLKVALTTKETVSAGQAIALQKGSALKADFDKALTDMQKDGTIEKLQQQYGIQ